MSASTWENIELKLPNRTFSENINFLFALHKRVFSACTAQRGMCYLCSVQQGLAPVVLALTRGNVWLDFEHNFGSFQLLRSLLCISAATGVGKQAIVTISG